MLPLAERQADRVKRIAENMAEEGQPSDTALAAAHNEAANFLDAMSGLTVDQRKEVMAKAEDGFKSLSDGPVVGDFSKYAGVGIANPLTMPVSDMPPAADLSLIEESKAGNGGWGAGNANGRAVEAQAGASSNDGAPSETPEEIAAREEAARVAQASRGNGTTTVVPAAS
jgi:hypothetical protein